MIFTETARLRLRMLQKRDLLCLAELIGDWEVTRWMVRVPYPYKLQDAEDYFALMDKCYQTGQPECKTTWTFQTR